MGSRSIKYICAITVGILSLLLHSGLAGAEKDLTSRPLADQGPTMLFTSIALLDVDEIDSANQSFVANVYMTVRWKDSRLSHAGPGTRVRAMAEVWNPQLLLVNRQRILTAFPDVVHISPEGDVLYRQRVWGPFSQPLEVQDFPFDSQDFAIHIASTLGKGEVEFVADQENGSGLADSFSLPDWKIIGWELDFKPYIPWGGTEAASAKLVFHAERYTIHFVFKLFLPLILIVIMSWIVFWIAPDQASTQIGIATTSMLTLIAYRFMISSMMPQVPYLTRIDYFVLGSTVLVFAALIKAALTSILVSSDRTETALSIDRRCRVLFPILFIGIIIFPMIL